MDISLHIALPFLAFLVSLFGVWYKINDDTNKKISEASKSASDEIKRTRDEVATLRAMAVSRAEHDQDIEKVKVEIRTFRDEVREDIRNLSVTLTNRLDQMVSRVLEYRLHGKD